MTAKHRNHAPKRQRRPDDLEKRIRRIERNYIRDVTKIATAVARVEINESIHRGEVLITPDPFGREAVKHFHVLPHERAPWPSHALGPDSYTEESG